MILSSELLEKLGFYYQSDAGRKTEYNNIGLGTLELSRIKRSDKIYRTENYGAEQPLKKTILLGDCPYWVYLVCMPIIVDFFRALLLEEFRCIAWIDDSLVEMTPQTIESVLQKVKFSIPKKTILKQSGLHHKSTLVLDYAELKQVFKILCEDLLLDTENEAYDAGKQPQTLRLLQEKNCVIFEELLGLTLPEKAKLLNRLYQDGKFALALYHDEIPGHVVGEIHELANVCPNLTKVILDRADVNVIHRQLQLHFPKLQIQINRFYLYEFRDLTVAEDAVKRGEFSIEGVVLEYRRSANDLKFICINLAEKPIPIEFYNFFSSLKIIKLINQYPTDISFASNTACLILSSNSAQKPFVINSNSDNKLEHIVISGIGVPILDLQNIVRPISISILSTYANIEPICFLARSHCVHTIRVKHLTLDIGDTDPNDAQILSRISLELSLSKVKPTSIMGMFYWVWYSGVFQQRTSLAIIENDLSSLLALFANQAHPKLLHLKLVRCQYNIDVLTEIAKIFPNVKTLEMVNCQGMESADHYSFQSLQRLIVKGNDRLFLNNPNLLFDLAPHASSYEYIADSEALTLPSSQIASIRERIASLPENCYVYLDTKQVLFENKRLPVAPQDDNHRIYMPLIDPTSFSPDAMQDPNLNITKMTIGFSIATKLKSSDILKLLSLSPNCETLYMIGDKLFGSSIQADSNLLSNSSIKRLVLKNVMITDEGLSNLLLSFRSIETVEMHRLHIIETYIRLKTLPHIRTLINFDFRNVYSLQRCCTASTIMNSWSVSKSKIIMDENTEAKNTLRLEALPHQTPAEESLNDTYFNSRQHTTGPQARKMFSKSATIHPASYRHHVLSYQYGHGLQLKPVKFKQHENVKALFDTSTASEKLIYVPIAIAPTSKPQPILTLTDKDELLATSPLPQGVNIVHDAERGQYYVETNNVIDPFSLEYILKQGREDYLYVPQIPKIDNEIETLRGLRFQSADDLLDNEASRLLLNKSRDAQLALLHHFFNSFDIVAEPAGILATDPPFIRYNKMFEQKRGSCANRSAAFLSLTKLKAIQIKRFVILNAIHAFPQVSIGRNQFGFDCGGVLDINDLRAHFDARATGEPQNRELTPASSISTKTLASAGGTGPAGLLSRLFKTAPVAELSSLSSTVPCQFDGGKYLASPVFESIMPYTTWLKSQALRLQPGARNIAVLIEKTSDRYGFIQHFRNSLDEHSTVILDLQEVPYESHRVRTLDDPANTPDIDEIKTAPLLQFLELDGENPIVIINGSDTSELGTDVLHQLIDTQRTFNNVPIREDAIFIILMSEHDLNTHGDAVYSRLRLITDCSLHLKRQTYKTEALLPRKALHHDLSKSLRLKGKLVATAEGMRYKTKFTHKAENLLLVNPPENYDEVNSFFDDSQTKSRVSFLNGRYVQIPRLFAAQEPLIFPNRFSIVLEQTEANAWQLPLNQFYFYYFDECHHSNAENILVEKPSLLKEFAGQFVIIAVTENLSAGQWIKILNKAEKYHCHLKLVLTPGVQLPESMQALWKNEILTHHLECSPQLQVIVAAEVEAYQSDRPVFPICPEMSYGDVVQKLDVKMTDKRLRSNTQEGLLLLCDLQPLVLRGQCHKDVAAALTSLCASQPFLMINGARVTMQNTFQLVIVDKSEKYWQHLEFSRLPNLPLLKSDYFNESEARRLSYFDRMRFEQMCARLSREQIRSRWLSFIDRDFKQTEERYQNINENADAFDAARVKAMLDAFEFDRFIVLLGDTGSGKSTFCFEILKNALLARGGRFYSGKQQFIDYLADDLPGDKLFYYDELDKASTTELNAVEGLNHGVVYFQNKLYRQKNRALVAGSLNRLTYSGRFVSTFLERHHDTVTFDLLPAWYLDQRIVQPMCKDLKIDLELGRRLLQIFLLYQNEDAEKVTPRNLKRMILMLALMQQVIPQGELADLLSFARYAGIATTQTLHSLSGWLNSPPYSHFTRILCEKIDSLKVQLAKHNVIYVPTLTVSVVMLLTHHWFRDLRIQKSEYRPYSLGGLIFRGIPGVSKSLLKRAFFAAMGYQDFNPANAHHPHNTVMWIRPSERYHFHEYLLLAAQQGWWVDIDEFNKLPAERERVLNRVLDALEDAHLPQQPGFELSGAQNFDEDVGCGKTSIALQNRNTIVDVPDFSMEEREDIAAALLESRPLAQRIIGLFAQERNRHGASRIGNRECFYEVHRIVNLRQQLLNYYHQVVLTHHDNKKCVEAMASQVKPFCEYPQHLVFSDCLEQVNEKLQRVLRANGYRKIELPEVDQSSFSGNNLFNTK